GPSRSSPGTSSRTSPPCSSWTPPSACAPRSSPRPRCPTSAWASSRPTSRWAPSCRTAPPPRSPGPGCSSSPPASSSGCSPPWPSWAMRCVTRSIRPAAPTGPERPHRPGALIPRPRRRSTAAPSRPEDPSPASPATTASVHSHDGVSPHKEKNMTITSNRRRFLQGTAAVGGLGALAACGQQSTEEQASQAAEENEQAAEEASELPNTGWERAEYDQVEDGGTLRLAVSQLSNTWNYYHTNGALADLNTILGPCWPGGNIADETGAVVINPDTVVSAEITSEDPQIVTVKYNPDAVWEHGTPITIKDFAAQRTACSGSDDAFQVASTTGWSDIADVRETDDEFTGEIEYSSTFPDWIAYIYPSLPESISSDPTEFNEGYVTTPTPSYGPFKV